mmetsp:Transcript_5417/g.14145  ORF Transcript_5417/g.14145 Transcript_5417/m.14145 type:complete len:82 (+) Transcript_5417:739-984(+)
MGRAELCGVPRVVAEVYEENIGSLGMLEGLRVGEMRRVKAFASLPQKSKRKKSENLLRGRLSVTHNVRDAGTNSKDFLRVL